MTFQSDVNAVKSMLGKKKAIRYKMSMLYPYHLLGEENGSFIAV